MGYTKDVRARVHKYFHANPDRILWRPEIAAEIDLREEQIRDACAGLARDGYITIIERARAWTYGAPKPPEGLSEPFASIAKIKLNDNSKFGKTYAEMNAVSAYPAEATGNTMRIIGELGENKVLLQDALGGLWAARYIGPEQGF